MLRLETFGRLALLRDATEAAALPRLRLSLLAVLAAAGDRGLSRDKIVALFWPDASPDNARHSLEQLVYALRRQLGDSLFLGSDPLRLNPDALTSDVWDFRRALKAGATEEAVALVGGPFLDGFYVNGGGDFERWTEEERQRIQASLAEALESLAVARRARG